MSCDRAGQMRNRQTGREREGGREGEREGERGRERGRESGRGRAGEGEDGQRERRRE